MLLSLPVRSAVCCAAVLALIDPGLLPAAAPKNEKPAASSTATADAAAARRARLADVIDQLMDTGLSRRQATELAQRIVDGDLEAAATGKSIGDAAGTLLRAGASQEMIAALVKEIASRRLTDRSQGGAVQGLIGAAVLEHLEKGSAMKVPPGLANRRGEIAKAVLNAQAELDAVGVARDSREYKAVIGTIVAQGLEGAAALQLVKTITDPLVDQATRDQNKPADSSPSGTGGGGAGKGPVVQGPDFLLPPPATTVVVPPTTTVPDAGKGDNGKPATPPAPPPSSAPAPPAPEPVSTPAPEPAPETPAPTPSTSGPDKAKPATPPPSTGGRTTGSPATTSGLIVVDGLIKTSSINKDGNVVHVYTDAVTGELVKKEIIMQRSDGYDTITLNPAGNPVGYEHTEATAGQSADSRHTNPNNSGSGGRTGNSGGGSGKGKNYDGTDTSGDPDDGTTDQTLTPEEKEAEKERRESENSPETAVATPLHPDFQNDKGNGLGLANATGGQLGGEQARATQRRLDLKKNGKGGTADPSRDGQRSSGILLTPEEQKNAGRAIDMKKTGGVTDPSRDAAGTTPVVDARDLKDLGLRGTGGAKGPSTGKPKAPAPAAPANPNSPVGGTPVPVPRPGTAAAAAAVKKVAPKISETVGANVQVKEVAKEVAK